MICALQGLFLRKQKRVQPNSPNPYLMWNTNLTALVTDLLSEQIVCLQLETSLDGLAHLKRLYLWVSDLLSPQVKFHHQRHAISLHTTLVATFKRLSFVRAVLKRHQKLIVVLFEMTLPRFTKFRNKQNIATAQVLQGQVYMQTGFFGETVLKIYLSIFKY